MLRYAFNRFKCFQLRHFSHYYQTFLREKSHCIASQKRLASISVSAALKDKIQNNAANSKPDEIFEAMKVDSQVRRRILTQGLEEFLRLTADNVSNEQLIFLLKCPGLLHTESLTKKQELLEKIWAKKSNEMSEEILLEFLRACRDIGHEIKFEDFLKPNSSREILQVNFFLFTKFQYTKYEFFHFIF